ncbi:MAG: glycoside hydrolase family 127 protein [Chitinophagaceae bacterium]|nr:MAG: glycoside hydrolase family 127 protein [Chitinophagaceae bacterium]
MKLVPIVTLILAITCQADAQTSLQKSYPLDFSQVSITDNFWKTKQQTVATTTINTCILYTENKTGRIRNFEKVASGQGKHEGIYYDDSDVYKAIEAIAYSLKNRPDSALERKTDEWIDKIASAQLPDGYLNTYYSLTGLDKRWTDMERHEDYCAGHLIEAGIAYHSTTGKKKLLDVATRFANHIDSMFRLGNRVWVSGHQEIELALMKLYHHTKERRYMDLAIWFLDQRGKGYGKGKIWDEWKDPDYCQDGLPVKDQTQITGHAVRAMYMYTGAADVAAVNNDAGYMKAMKTIWDDVVFRNLYITGGIGAQGSNEGFGKDYDLPNETAYCETCASVGMVLWNQRMNMLTGEAKYIDVLERSLYNAALDGLSQSGDRFFYGNPLASTGTHNRSEWFGTACCPSNIARLIASLGNYIYSYNDNTAWINLFIGSTTGIMGNTGLALNFETKFPWKGENEITVLKAAGKTVELRIRIPGWLSAPVPGNLYHYTDSVAGQPGMLINGKKVTYKIDNGYAVVARKWKKGDRINFDVPMRVRKVASHPLLKNNIDKVALQYGPLVYCVEDKDNAGNAYNFIVPDSLSVNVEFIPGLLGGVNRLSFEANVMEPAGDKKSVQSVRRMVRAVPYFSWNNRGPGEMQVWLPTTISAVRLMPGRGVK